MYLDILMTSIHELEVLQEFDFQDADKRCCLMANLSGHTEINYLLQACRDKKDLTFVEAVHYLRENSLTIEGHTPSKKRILYASGDAEDNTVTSERSLVETIALFEQFAKETNIFQAYQTFNSSQCDSPSVFLMLYGRNWNHQFRKRSGQSG